ncbi:hypothetical protein HMI56_006342 [Coelomomyces lativittatus]|nr:hypothetical protein HMI56_006342 [Coelomomyces lativittatus]
MVCLEVLMLHDLEQVMEYEGPTETPETSSSLLKFIHEAYVKLSKDLKIPVQVSPTPPTSPPIIPKKDSLDIFEAAFESAKNLKYNIDGEIQILNEDDFVRRTKGTGPWLVLFCETSANQCQHLYKDLLPELSLYLKKKVHTAIFYTYEDSYLAYSFSVSRFPTIVLIKNGYYRKFHGPIDLDSLESFALTCILPPMTLMKDLEGIQTDVRLVYNLHQTDSTHHTVFLNSFQNAWLFPWIQFNYMHTSSLSPGITLFIDQLAPMSLLTNSSYFNSAGISHFLFQNGFPLLLSLDETNVDLLMGHTSHSSIVLVAAIFPGYYEREKTILKSIALHSKEISQNTGISIHVTYVDRVRFQRYVEHILQLPSHANIAICVPSLQTLYVRVPSSGKHIPVDETIILDALRDISSQLKGEGGDYLPEEKRVLNLSSLIYLTIALLLFSVVVFIYVRFISKRKSSSSKFD